MILESKYNLGDVVFAGTAEHTTERAVCPECLGSRHWPVTSPSGNNMVVDCPACTFGYEVRGFVETSVIVPVVQKLTVGMVKYENDYDTPGSMTFKYMCLETGIGSGSVWSEGRLCSSREAAMELALAFAAKIQKEQDAQTEAEYKRKLKEFKRRKRCASCGGTGSQTI
jgi:hypothetical protein